MSFSAPRGPDDMTTPAIGRRVQSWEAFANTWEQSLLWWGLVPNDDQAGTKNAERLQAAIDYAVTHDLPLIAPSGTYWIDVGVVQIGAADAPVAGFSLRGMRPGHGQFSLEEGGTVFKAAGAPAVADLAVACANINTGANTVAVFQHGMETGDGPARWKSVEGTLPGGFERDRDYWFIKVDGNTFKLADSEANALANTPIDITSQGTGSLVLYTGSEAIITIRNASNGRINDIAFEGENVAKYCVRMAMRSTDTQVGRGIRNWNFDGCAVANASVYNFFVDGDSANSRYGDASALNLSGMSWMGSHGAATFAHFRNSTQYSFGIDFRGGLGIGSTSSWPSHWISMQSGTANVHGGVNGDCGVSAYHFDGAALVDPPSMTFIGCEAQSSAKTLITEMADSGCKDPIRSTVFLGCLIDDIGTPYVTEQVYWDMPGPAALVFVGGSVLGDVNIADATATVIADGVLLRASNTGTGNDTQLSAFTGNPDRAFGTWREQVTTMDTVGVLRARLPGIIATVAADVPVYADNAAAVGGGLAAGDIYQTSAGVMMICQGA